MTRAIERFLYNNDSPLGVMTIQSARQTAKNEVAALVQARAMILHSESGGDYVRAAPTWKPQIVFSKQRLEKHLRNDPLTMGRWRCQEGFLYRFGKANLWMLSSDKNANVVGATASIAMDVDEAHHTDRDKFEEDFQPMRARTNAPCVMWGVSAAGQDLLSYYVRHNNEIEHPELNLRFPAALWCAENPAYAAHYAERVAALGVEHPVIQTQYDLIEVEALDAFLSPKQREIILSGTHERQVASRPGRQYVALIDVGGDDDLERADEQVRLDNPSQDSTAVIILDLDWSYAAKNHGWPEARIVDLHWWTGMNLTEQEETICKMMVRWWPTSIVVDGRGLGLQLARAIKHVCPQTEIYEATAPSVTHDLWDCLARVNNGAVKFYRPDEARPQDREFIAQLRHTKREVRSHENYALKKPSAKLHIDMVKALSYLGRACKSPMTYQRFAR